MKITITSILLLISIVSCSHSGSINNPHAGEPTANVLVLKDSVEFQLDKETVPLINYMQYIDLDSIQVLSFLNDYNNKIYFYDYRNRQYVGSFPNKTKLKEKIQGYLIDNNILYLYSYTSGKVYCYSINGELFLDDFSILKNQTKNYDLLTPHPYLTTISPIIKYENLILSTGYRSGETKFETTTNRPVLSVYNVDNGNLTYSVNFPKQYSDYNWGGSMLFRLSYYAVKPDGTIVLSFPASHDLAITSIGNLKDIKYIYGGSHNLKKICSFPHAKGFRSYESHDIWSWYMRTPSYEGILYDKYRNIYYRIARLPNKEYKLGDNGNEKPVIVVVLDEDFHYLGETMLPKDLNLFSSNIFVSKEGLNVQVVDSNEDILKFYRYVYAKVH